MRLEERTARGSNRRWKLLRHQAERERGTEMQFIVKKTLKRTVLASAMAVLLAGTMAAPALAATEVDYTVEEGGTTISQTAAFNDAAAGLSWDGADAITMNNASLFSLTIIGGGTVQLQGESSASYINANDGDLTLKGDTNAAAEDKPVLNFVPDTSWQEAGAWASGTTTVEGATINFAEGTEYGYVGATGDVVIDRSKVAAANTENMVWIQSYNGAISILESVADLGTSGGICAETALTIDNSEITARFADEEDITLAAHCHNGDITLKNMQNGTVLEEVDGFKYVSSGDEDGLFLKPASTPKYYVNATKGTPANALPATADTIGIGIFATMAIVALGAAVVARRRMNQE